MAQSDTVAEKIKLALRPSEIVAELGISESSVFGYIRRAVGERKVRAIDVVRTIPEVVRAALRENDESTLSQLSDDCIISSLDRKVYQEFGDCVGDVYENIRKIEIGLHRSIKSHLKASYSDNQNAWWIEGVPVSTRKKCLERWTEDKEQQEPFAYTDLLDLLNVVEKRWQIFRDKLPSELASDRQAFREPITRLNHIRRKVMHPSREQVPSDDEYDFTQYLLKAFGFR